ncbi:hypothetical protein GCM10010521_55930 [Streptomyces rameus]|uniref:Anti-sigma-28 factor FlgM C-terminal domain-containing protein n=1 Tax=Streptomyces rameus TaxID=68261 RepID=A0ABN3V2E9_9ACTN
MSGALLVEGSAPAWSGGAGLLCFGGWWSVVGSECGQVDGVGADGVQEWGTQASFLPSEFVAGMQTDRPVESRLALIDELRRRVENNPFHRDAQFLNELADRFAQEIAGSRELTAEALEADLSADQGAPCRAGRDRIAARAERDR